MYDNTIFIIRIINNLEENDMIYTEDFKNQILRAFGDTDDIKKALQNNPHDLFYFLFDKFNFYNNQLPRDKNGQDDISKYTDLHVNLLNTVLQQSDVLLYLGAMVKKELLCLPIK